MPHALARPRLGLGLAAVLALACGRRGAGSPDDPSDPAMRAIHARMPPLERAAVGQGPGFVEGGFVYMALKPGALQKYLQSLPLDPDTAREVSRAGVDLGFDPRVDDISARLGLDPDAFVTATIARPITGTMPGVREALQRLGSSPLPNPFPAAATTPADVAPWPAPRPAPPPEPRAPPSPPQPYQDSAPVQPVQPIAEPWKPPPPAAPPPDQEAMARGAGSLAFHNRVHLPARDPAALPALLARMVRKERPPEIATLCGQIGPSEFCFGDASALLVARKDAAAVVLDLFFFPAGTGAAWDPDRVTAVTSGLAAAPADLPALSSLRGDFAAYADAAAVPAVAELYEIADAVRDLRWYEPQQLAERIARALGQRAALEQLRETRRLFTGMRLEAAVDPETVQVTMSWEPADAAAADLAEKTFTRPAAGVGVPTLAGLCDGALACWRSSGLPPLAGLGELAIGLYGRDERAFRDAIDSAGDFGAVVILLETWPSALGMLERWGREQKGMEAGIIRTVLDILGRVEGFGGSLRSLQVGGRSVQTDYVAYTRVQGQDLALFRSLVGLSSMRFSPVTVAGVDAKVEAGAVPDADAPVQVYLVTDPGTLRLGDKDVEFGWIAAADGQDRLKWLLADVERDKDTNPAFYGELPDLWRLIGSFDDGPRDVGFLQSWLTGRGFRLAGDVVGGRVRLDAEFARRAAPAK
ncbi:hypothetical protein SAMN02745121_06065 [Nannocystis exedens]|uniref:Uncharacterized protein n=1 Tax=Nannocystis exedens TaxID=54 RepID=A0A1I2EG54_9BACT|nr:hypothetical protein [Nannocystis exedens]PCC74755.1 hypothetical protein NAEX_07854 [Nannocystis exedens]SFE91431.1 hypothetical protein SAMN02745121_06065 [Nannocystis exedens]